MDGTDPAPTLSSLSVNIDSRVDLNTDLNVSKTFTFTVTGYDQLTDLDLIVTGGDDKQLVLPTVNGSQSQNATLSGIDSSIMGAVTFQLQGTYADGTVNSNSVTITIRDQEDHEFVHFGTVLSTEGASDIVFADDDISTATALASTFTVSGIPDDPNLYRIYFAVPEDFGSVSSVQQSGFQLYPSQFDTAQITVAGEVYNVAIFKVGSAVDHTYNNVSLEIS